ncbi:MAG TPA: hypothetical protein VM513_06270 [Kofleriaceae bacterium]|jgi:hypothetical protein|nr:hypothetical protein [Kofleriaceae bacterium]
MSRLLVIVMVILGFASGCDKDVHVRYPAPPDMPTGTLVLLLSKPASGVTVSINGVLVVEDVKTQRVVVANAPAGNQDIVMTANGSDKAMRVWVDTEHATTIPLGVPDTAPSFLKSVMGTLITVVAYSLLR